MLRYWHATLGARKSNAIATLTCSKRYTYNFKGDSLFQIKVLYWTHRFLGRKCGSVFAAGYNHVYLPLFLLVEAVGGLYTNWHSKMFLATLCMSPSSAWIDADITELLTFRHKSLVAEELDAKYPLYNSAASNPSGEKLRESIDINNLDISASQYTTHFFL
jgi:hypothetical protein